MSLHFTPALDSLEIGYHHRAVLLCTHASHQRHQDRQLLQEADWESIQTSQQARDRIARQALHPGPEKLRWLLDNGAKLDKSAISMAVWGSPVSAGAASVLLDRGYDFAGSRLLQQAARQNQMDLMRVPLDAGADPNEDLPALDNDRGESPTWALRHAVQRKHTGAVRLLLMFGARPERIAYDGQGRTEDGQADW